MLEILVVDDEKSIRITLREFLKNEGYEVHLAEDAFDALAILEKEDIDIVLSDIILPKKSGTELLHDIQESFPYVKTIMMTGEPTVDTATLALRQGAFDYLSKPVGKNAVLSIVAKAAQIKHLEDENRHYRNRLEQLVDEKTAQLRESQEKYKSIVDNVGIGIALISPEMKILELNNQMREWFPSIAAGDQSVCFASLNSPPRVTPCEECPTSTTYADGKDHEVVLELSIGENLRKYRVVSFPVFDSSGNISAVIEMMEDITERVALEMRVRQSEKLESIGTLASGIAHDINNTLAPMTLYADALLSSEEGLSEKGRRYIETMRRSTKDIESTVDRLRMFYKNNGDNEMQIQSVELPKIIDQVIELTQPRWKDIPQRNGITIEMKTEVENDIPNLAGMESEIREALINLVFNAADAITENGAITIRLDKLANEIILEVEDTGVGMNEDLQKRCLEPFVTTKGEGGSGLGLSLVFGIVKRHRGMMDIKSTEGKGTTVRLSFPVGILDEADTSVERVDGDTPPMRVLCIDDEEAVREALKEILEIAGHSVTAFESGERGVQFVKETIGSTEEPQAVITDLGMANMDGWDVAEKIREIAPELPIFLLSGWGNLMSREEKESSLVDGVLSKPPKIRDLKNALQKAYAMRSKKEAEDEK